ncbi:MAG: tetratricopeptide repeat protein [Acidobacteria bacterium]|nr:tetratricopeptide repeat protein [Acidobacteriota bacterium]
MGLLSIALFAVAFSSAGPRQLLEGGEYKRAERELRAMLASEVGEGRASLLHLLALSLHHQGRYSEASAPLSEALAIAVQQGRQPYEMVNLYAAIGVNRIELGRVQEANEALREALGYVSLLQKPYPAETAQALSNLGTLAMSCKRIPDAERLYRQSLDLSIAAHGVGDAKTALVQENLAKLYLARGELDEAESLWERVLATREQMLGPNHPAVAAALVGLSTIEVLRGNGLRAGSFSARAVAIGARSAPQGALHATALAAHGNALRLLRRYGDAVQEYEAARRLLEAQHGADHPTVATVLVNLAGAKLALGLRQEAQQLVKRAAEIRGAQSVAGVHSRSDD